MGVRSRLRDALSARSESAHLVPAGSVPARRGAGGSPLGRGVMLLGTVWTGGAEEAFAGAVVVDPKGRVAYVGPSPPEPLASDLQVLGGSHCWVGPGIVDAHVHLAFGSLEDCLPAGLVGVRDLGAPSAAARQWRTGRRSPRIGCPFVAAAGPIITAPEGYPSRSWGADGFAAFAGSVRRARALVRRLANEGADVVKIALEPGDADWPVPSSEIARAVVDEAHTVGLAVVAHALRVDMVRRAVESGVDELAHTPTERLPADLVERIAGANIAVVSTLQTFFSDGDGEVAAANAADLHRAGVVLRYGTDFGNAGTRPGVDPRELDRLADTGLGRLGALRAATETSAQAPGMRWRTGHLRVGEPAALVLLSGDPVAEPEVWLAPLAVLVDGRLVVN